jgi:predicted DNA-binding mobile mystery protein A
MKDNDILRLEQLEETVRPFRVVMDTQKPRGGWVRTMREALGMTNVQLARRLGRKAPQTIEDMQEYEVTETIKLRTLRELADALGCRLVYALVPTKPLDEMRRDQAQRVAARLLRTASHSMKMEDQGVSAPEEESELQRQIRRLLSGNPKKLWD